MRSFLTALLVTVLLSPAVRAGEKEKYPLTLCYKGASVGSNLAEEGSGCSVFFETKDGGGCLRARDTKEARDTLSSLLGCGKLNESDTCIVVWSKEFSHDPKVAVVGFHVDHTTVGELGKTETPTDFIAMKVKRGKAIEIGETEKVRVVYSGRVGKGSRRPSPCES